MRCDKCTVASQCNITTFSSVEMKFLIEKNSYDDIDDDDGKKSISDKGNAESLKRRKMESEQETRMESS